MRIFNVEWIVFTMMIAVLGFTIFGNTIRLYSMPDMYFTDGTLWGALKQDFLGTTDHNCQTSSLSTL